MERVAEARKRNGFEKRKNSNKSSVVYEPPSANSLGQPASGQLFK